MKIIQILKTSIERVRLAGRVAGVSLLALLLAWSQFGYAGEHMRGEKPGNHRENAAKNDAHKQTGSGPKLKQHRSPVYCGDILSEPGQYKLDTDLVCTASIQITASNVHLDLKGHSITCLAEAWEYPEPLGVPVEDRDVWVKGINVNFNRFDDPSTEPVVSGVQIKNGTISNCWGGITLYKADRTKITNMSLFDHTLDARCCSGRGLEVVNSHNGIIRANTVARSSEGIAIFSSTGNTVARNVVTDNLLDGLLLVDSNGNTLKHNTANGNRWGMWVEGSSNNTIKHNKTNHNTDNGIIAVPGSNENVIKGNTSNQNGAGIAFIGYVLNGSPIGFPVAADNFVKENITQDNNLVDVAEANLELTTFDIILGDACFNAWKNNNYETAFAVPDCID